MNSVPIESPLAITSPMLNRETAPAPLATICGTTPSTIAAVVIRIGRSLMLAARSIASRFGMPLRCRSLANPKTLKVYGDGLDPEDIARELKDISGFVDNLKELPLSERQFAVGSRNE